MRPQQSQLSTMHGKPNGNRTCIRCLSPYEARQMLHRHRFPVKSTCMKPKTECSSPIIVDQSNAKKSFKQKEQQQNENTVSLLLSYLNNESLGKGAVHPPHIKQAAMYRTKNNHGATKDNCSRSNIISTPDSFAGLVYSHNI